MIYYITKYHIKYSLNIYSREESSSKKELLDWGDIAHFNAEYPGKVLYEVEEARKYLKVNKSTNTERESENIWRNQGRWYGPHGLRVCIIHDVYSSVKDNWFITSQWIKYVLN